MTLFTFSMLQKDVVQAQYTEPHLDITLREVLGLIAHIKENEAQYEHPYRFIARKLAKLNSPVPLLPAKQIERLAYIQYSDSSHVAIKHAFDWSKSGVIYTNSGPLLIFFSLKECRDAVEELEGYP